MGKLIYFEDHRADRSGSDPVRLRLRGESLIPVQLALDEYDIEKCFSRLADFGQCAVIPRANPEDSGKILFLIRIKDAISLNQHLLDREEGDSQAMAHRIDHIQMLENCESSLLGKAWNRIGLEGGLGGASESGPGGVNHIRQ